MNLGLALWRLGERESGTGKLTEAVAAYRAALEEWTREAAPYWHDLAQQNLARCLALLEQRRKNCRVCIAPKDLSPLRFRPKNIRS
jgi:hypothetical protein